MLKQETLTPLPVPTVCGNCGLEEHHLLLQVRHRGIFRRLCTTCVLRLHPQSFCPTCFAFYGSSPPSGPEFVNCTECYSVSHSRCAAATMSPYICPLCVNPNSPIFMPKKAKDGRREIDPNAASVLYAAASIAAYTLEKAAEGAKALAEKRAKEAAFTRKKAKEALEHVAVLEAKERQKRKEISPAEASGSASGTGTVLDRNQKICNANNSFIAKNAEPNRISNQLSFPKNAQEPNRISNQLDGPNEVSVRLNAVGLREKERVPPPAFRGPVAAPFAPPKPNGAVFPAQNVGGSINNSIGVKPSNGLYSAPPAVDRPQQHMHYSHVKDENTFP